MGHCMLYWAKYDKIWKIGLLRSTIMGVQSAFTFNKMQQIKSYVTVFQQNRIKIGTK